MESFYTGGVLHDRYNVDIEQKAGDDAHLLNNTVRNFIWQDVTVTVKDNKTGKPKAILDNVEGIVKAGEICALMGPSGCGKTTLLNVLAHRDAAAGARVEGVTLINGSSPSAGAFRRMTCYVEQEDALIGSLTVRETLHFAARLAHKNTISKADRIKRIDALLDSFGLRHQQHTLIGTPIRKGISGGQKRRVSVAAQLITAPKIMFLDEPTSGLDSAASYEVIQYIKEVAKRNNLIVIASIHQPSTSTFQMFDKLLLLSGGKPFYFGSVEGVETYFQSLGFPMPFRTNPAEFILDLMNIDFASHQEAAKQRLHEMQVGWARSNKARDVAAQIHATSSLVEPPSTTKPSSSSFFTVVMTLVHRSFIKSYRDVVAYGIRIAMYIGLAIMMGTVWLRLESKQSDIQPYINAIFFGSAFMSFMAVAYVPSFLEDRLTFIKERANGLYGPTAFMLSNFLIGLPYLFLIAVIFSVIAYWLSNFQPTAEAFFTWIMWLFLDLVAAESLVVLVSTVAPVFVISLAVTAFANGLWMSVGGFLVAPTILNVFWRYVFHYIDYQSYVFQGMMVNEFADRTYSCGEGCHCMYQTELASECRISGIGVLDEYGYKTGRTGEWVGILLAIVAGYRLLGLLAMFIRK
ncbi:P-loop containing nucleoside triphosphate hydrolase protein [Leptodontidium sp. 2 PMI_412]|nr:P-loop containing nucleoside triphosphate hydrolase protein [Leptodontidium sp. 2 PMI_412]